MISDLLKNLKFETTEHWGPEPIEKEEFKDIPIGFYNRFEKIGRCCDLNALLNKKAEEEDQFIKVDTKKVQKNPAVVTRNKVYIAKRAEQKNQQIYKYYSKKWTKNYVRAKQSFKTRFKESVMIKNDWIPMNDIRPNFDKEIDSKVEIQCFKEVGVIRKLDPEVEKISRREYKLNFKESIIKSHFTENDKVLKNLVLKYFEQEDLKKKVIILLPQFLTALMTLKFSQYPWHIYIIKKGNILIMNNYEDTPQTTYLDLYAVNQNTQNNMPDQANVLDNCKMATQVARSFRDQLASGEIAEEVEDDEQEEEQEQEQQDKTESYKKYVKVSFGDFQFYTYAEIDGAKVSVHPYTGQQTTKYYLSRSLVEVQSNYEWKKKFETAAAGDVISSEYLANSVNWQKWLIESELTGVQNFKAAYISENNQGVFNILNVMDLSSKSIKSNVGFNIKKCWNVLKTVVESLFEEADGNYIAMKSAYQPNLKVFQLPEEEEEEQGNDQ